MPPILDALVRIVLTLLNATRHSEVHSCSFLHPFKFRLLQVSVPFRHADFQGWVPNARQGDSDGRLIENHIKPIINVDGDSFANITNVLAALSGSLLAAYQGWNADRFGGELPQ